MPGLIECGVGLGVRSGSKSHYPGKTGKTGKHSLTASCRNTAHTKEGTEKEGSIASQSNLPLLKILVKMEQHFPLGAIVDTLKFAPNTQ